MNESAPWVVEDDLVKKFNLPSKFSDFLLDPHKVINFSYMCVICGKVLLHFLFLLTQFFLSYLSFWQRIHQQNVRV